jgi:ABC-type lipoprotein release transport system permease subunit
MAHRASLEHQGVLAGGRATTTAAWLADALAAPKGKDPQCDKEVKLALLRLLLRSRFRHGWRSWLPLCLLVALASGLVLAGIAAGRRTATAFPRYEAAHGYDALLFSEEPVPGITALPEVASATLVSIFASGIPTCACSRPIGNSQFAVDGGAPTGLRHLVKLVAGRMPDPSDPDQVLASFTMAQDLGVRIGTVIHVPFYASSQRKTALSGARIRPVGTAVAFHVVGIEAAETEFPGTTTSGYDLYSTQAFARTFGPKTFAFSDYYVRLRHGPADLPRFAARARALGPVGVTDLGTEANAIESSIRPQAVGWWILAGLAALVGIVVVAQALARQAAVEAEPYPTLSALGVTRRQLVVLCMTTTLVIAVGGVIGGVAIAFGLSPLTPVGEARLADPSTGFAFDASALLPGALAAIIVVLALGLWPAIRTARTHRPAQTSQVARPSRIVSLLASAGAPASALIGVRHALQRGRGRTAVPVGSALVGSILAVTALCATAVFGASLTHLTSTPALYGQSYDLQLSPDSNTASAQLGRWRSVLERDRAISGISFGISGSVSINGRNVAAIAGQRLRGQLPLTTIKGRLPGASDEIALGAATLRQAGAHIGSLVRVTVPGPKGGTRTSAYRVVGTIVFPPGLGTGGLGRGASFTLGGLLGAQCARAPAQSACQLRAVISAGGGLLVRAVPGPAGQAALTRLARAYPSEVSFPVPPTSLVNFGEAVNFPFIFGVLLVLFGTATLVHVLVVSVATRRREAGLLKTLGFIRRQVAFAVLWQTTTVALAGIVVGVPAGIAVGRLVWRIFAGNLGVLPVPVVTAWAIAAVAFGAILIANVLAVGPALVASRSRPASLLKAE